MDDPPTPRFAFLAEKLAHLQDGDNAGQAMKMMREPLLISAPHKELGTVAFQGSLGFSGP